MKKESLIARAERWHETSKKMPLMGYRRQNQEEITEVAVAIIKALCNTKDLTKSKAKEALKMATDMLEEQAENEIIS